MCHLCKTKNQDWKFINGARARLFKVKLYRVFRDQVVPLNLCKICTIELFMKGEKRFLMDNVPLLKDVSHNMASYIGSSSDEEEEFYF